MSGKIYKIVLFMKRKPGISVEAFRDYYESHHAPLAEQYSRGIHRYVRRYIEPQVHPETGVAQDLPDVLTELWFQDEAVFKATLGYMSSTIMPDVIVEDEKNLFDRDSFRIATVVECDSDFPGKP